MERPDTEKIEINEISIMGKIIINPFRFPNAPGLLFYSALDMEMILRNFKENKAANHIRKLIDEEEKRK